MHKRRPLRRAASCWDEVEKMTTLAESCGGRGDAHARGFEGQRDIPKTNIYF